MRREEAFGLLLILVALGITLAVWSLWALPMAGPFLLAGLHYTRPRW